jgi:hypothetical protein
LGSEYVSQEGTTFWERLRTERGWTRDDVERLTEKEATEGFGVPVIHERQEMFEERPDFPDLQELEALATLYDMTPGQLLDRCYTEEGERIRGDG